MRPSVPLESRNTKWTSRQKPGQYLLGILLDGESYGAVKTVPDQEIAQIDVLNGLGWNILRIWTMDWWDNRQKELERILNYLEELKRQPPKLAPLPIVKSVPPRSTIAFSLQVDDLFFLGKTGKRDDIGAMELGKFVFPNSQRRLCGGVFPQRNVG